MTPSLLIAFALIGVLSFVCVLLAGRIARVEHAAKLNDDDLWKSIAELAVLHSRTCARVDTLERKGPHAN